MAWIYDGYNMFIVLKTTVYNSISSHIEWKLRFQLLVFCVLFHFYSFIFLGCYFFSLFFSFSSIINWNKLHSIKNWIKKQTARELRQAVDEWVSERESNANLMPRRDAFLLLYLIIALRYLHVPWVIIFIRLTLNGRRRPKTETQWAIKAFNNDKMGLKCM